MSKIVEYIIVADILVRSKSGLAGDCCGKFACKLGKVACGRLSTGSTTALFVSTTVLFLVQERNIRDNNMIISVIFGLDPKIFTGL